MKSLDGMLRQALLLKILLLLLILFIPIFLSGATISQPIQKSDAGFIKSSYKFSLVAGDFQYFNVELTEDVKQICIIAYYGDFIPDFEHRTERNYYRWEYKNGEWNDISGYSKTYLNETKCFQKNTTYSFYLGLDDKANPGKWNIKILINNKDENESDYTIIVIAPFQIFLSTLMGVYHCYYKDEKLIVDSNFICSDRKKIMTDSQKDDINDLVDDILKKQSSCKKEKESEEILDFSIFKNKQVDETETIRTTFYSYQKSKLKTPEKNLSSFIFFKGKSGGGHFLSITKGVNFNRVVTFLLIIFLLTVSAAPIIAPEDKSSSLTIDFFRISPEIIYLNESIFVEASVSDLKGIQSVNAEINNDTELDMKFIEGNRENNTIYSGLWNGNWQAQNVTPGKYVITITTTNVNNESISQQKIFTILTESKDKEQNNDSQYYDDNSTKEESINTTLPDTSQNKSNFSESNSSENNYYDDVSQDNNTLDPNQTGSNNENESIVIIADKRHEEVSILPGSRFYVERTINSLNETNVVFAPMFSDSLTLESIEIIDNSSENEEIETRIKKFEKAAVFNSGFGKKPIEEKIEKIKNELPSEIKKLNKIAYVENIDLNSSRTIRLWFKAPTWEQLETGMDSSGKISYLVFSDDGTDDFDFEGSTWWNANWGYRKLVTVNSSLVDGDLVNFPILVSITDSDLANKAQANGNDIAFVMWSDNSTKLNHEIELFNGTSGELVCWVNVSNLSGSVDTKIWMYYNNSVCGNQQNIAGVWEGWDTVTHLSNTTGNDLDSTDSTYSYAQTGTVNSVSGVVGLARQTSNGDNNYLMKSAFTDSRPITVMAWVYFNSAPVGYSRVFSREQTGSTGLDWEWGTSLPGGLLRWFISTSIDSNTGISSRNWTFVTTTFNSGTGSIYINGKFDVSGSMTDKDCSTYPLYLFRSGKGTGRYMDGAIDEFRIYPGELSAEWINTSYNTMNYQDTFIIVGSEDEFVINTSVDKIYPYNVTISPKTITATGPNGLDNVTLWYRYSNDNFTSGLTWEDNEGVIWRIQEFTSGSGNWEIPSGVTEIDVLVIAGGGGSGMGTTVTNRNGGGGGAGGLVWLTNITNLGEVAIKMGNTISYSVGSGGAGATATNVKGGIGSDSIFGNLTAKGGGGGGSSGSRPALDGGSGGGGGIIAAATGSGGTGIQPTQSGWSGIFGFGNNGANAAGGNAGGGGGADGAANGINGGSGMDMSNYFGVFHGVNGIFSKGGNANSDGSAGPANSGYGGNARANNDGGNGAAGGSGIIIIRWQEWKVWDNPANPDTSYPWSWDFNFPNGRGYYEFYSIGAKNNDYEKAPASADAICYYYPINPPVINSYNLRNSTGSKLNNNTGLLDINQEYYFSINITDLDGWEDIKYVNITAWYDNGSEATTYNQTLGGNLNMFLQYQNTTGTANYNLLWPKDEVELILINCSETIIDENTRIINISFKPKNQVRWANSNNSWDSTPGITNNSYSWNFNISVKDATNAQDWVNDEYGVYKYTSISPAQDWVDVNVLPGFSDTTNIVAITYSSNYNFNITIYFEDNLINTLHGTTIPIANNVVILEETDPNDDITSNITFLGIGEANAVDIINDSGIFSLSGVNQTVYVQFMVFVPFGTLGGKYTARVATKIIQN